jgi:ABC-type transport system involved in cytochrome bd biosynthesis fused ATPase/permease subunit
MWEYYRPLLSEAFHQTVGIASLEELPLTAILGILGAACFVVWTRAPMKDLRALAFAAVAPVILVLGGRFLLQAILIPVARQGACEADKTKIAADRDDYKAKVLATVNDIEKEDLATEYANADAAIQTAQKELTEAQSSLARAPMRNMLGQQAVAMAIGQWVGAKANRDAITKRLRARLDSLRTTPINSQRQGP